MANPDLLNFSIDFFLDEQQAAHLREVISIFRNVQKNMTALVEKDDEKTLTGIKAGTIILLSTLKKMSQGKMPKEFTKEDYADIAKAVSEYAVLMDDHNDWSAAQRLFDMTEYFDNLPQIKILLRRAA